MRKARKPTATCRAVRDLPQQAVIDGDRIRVISRLGRKKVGEYGIPLTEWTAAQRGPTANPRYNKAQVVARYTTGLDEGPGAARGDLPGRKYPPRSRRGRWRFRRRELDRFLKQTAKPQPGPASIWE